MTDLHSQKRTTCTLLLCVQWFQSLMVGFVMYPRYGTEEIMDCLSEICCYTWSVMNLVSRRDTTDVQKVEVLNDLKLLGCAK